MRIIRSTRNECRAFADWIEIPLHPFFGASAVAPPDVSGRISSAPPWIHAGNLDNKNSWRARRFHSGACERRIVSRGRWTRGPGQWRSRYHRDGDFADWNFSIDCRKDMHLRWAARRDADALHHDGSTRRLNEATKMALREMIDFLVTENTSDAPTMLINFSSVAGRSRHHATSRWQQRRARDDPESDLHGAAQVIFERV